MYSELLMDHFKNPRNVGDMPDADGVGMVGNPTCGDVMTIYIKVKDDIITDIKFKTFGCGAAIASSSYTTELVKGKKIDDVLKFTRNDISEGLGGLPPVKVHCSILALDALREAIENYRSKQKNAS